MGKSKVELAVQSERKLARDIAFKLILTPAVIVIILNIVLVKVFFQLGLLKLFSDTVTGWTIMGLDFLWLIYVGFLTVFVIEPRAYNRRMILPLVIATISFLMGWVGILLGLTILKLGRI